MSTEVIVLIMFVSIGVLLLIIMAIRYVNSIAAGLGDFAESVSDLFDFDSSADSHSDSSSDSSD
jgi:hypothetical protein